MEVVTLIAFRKDLVSMDIPKLLLCAVTSPYSLAIFSADSCAFLLIKLSFKAFPLLSIRLAIIWILSLIVFLSLATLLID